MQDYWFIQWSTKSSLHKKHYPAQGWSPEGSHPTLVVSVVIILPMTSHSPPDLTRLPHSAPTTCPGSPGLQSCLTDLPQLLWLSLSRPFLSVFLVFSCDILLWGKLKYIQNPPHALTVQLQQRPQAMQVHCQVQCSPNSFLPPSPPLSSPCHSISTTVST